MPGFERVDAPWTPEQVENLNDYQMSGVFHPYTCKRSAHGMLIATPDGWMCNQCTYTQPWAHRLMTSGEWRALADKGDYIGRLT